MPAQKKQTTEEAHTLLKGNEDGVVADTKPLYTNGKAAILAGRIRRFLAEKGETIIGFEKRLGLGNTYVHTLGKARQIQIGTFKRLATGLGIKPLKLFDQLVAEASGKPVLEAATPEDQADNEVVAQAKAYLSRRPGEAQILIPNIPDVGDIVLNTAAKTYQVFKSVRVVARG